MLSSSGHTDHLNTPRLVADATGTTVWRWDQAEPFGVNTPDENPSALGTFDLPLRLPGQYFDKETILHYNYFRDYDLAIGRYIQSDPVGVAGGINTYAYVDGNSLANVDPYGQFSIWGAIGAGSVAITIYAAYDTYQDCMKKQAALIVCRKQLNQAFANAARNLPNSLTQLQAAIDQDDAADRALKQCGTDLGRTLNDLYMKSGWKNIGKLAR